MANCIYCGLRAGFFSRQHAECRERRQSATQMIPDFVARYLSNPIPVERFSELLLAAAEQSFISKKTLKDAVSASLNHFISGALEHRLITSQEEERITHLLQAFEIEIEDAIFERLVKADILRSLQDGRMPDRVEVMDPLPIPLRPDERVLWIFNRIESKRNKAADSDGEAQNVRRLGELPYVRQPKTGWPLAPKKLLLETTGDLVVTNYNLHLLSGEHAPRRIRFPLIWNLEPFRNGIGIVAIKNKNDRKLKVGRIITLDDPWFAINLISGLINFSRVEGAPQIDSRSL